MTASSASPAVLRRTVAGTGSWVSSVIGQPPEGRRWRLVTAQVTALATAPSERAQHIFLWSEFLKQPGLPNPNQDFYARIRLNPRAVGRFVSRGGYDAGLADEYHHTTWLSPISLVFGMGVKFDCDAALGTEATYEVAFQEEGGAESDLRFHYSYPQTGPLQVYPVGGPPPGHFWRVECATVSLRVADGEGPRLARLVRKPDGLVLAELTKFAPAAGRSADLAATGGYSSEQTGPAAGGRGSQTVWNTPVYVRSGEILEVQLQGPEGDKGHYAVALSRFPEGGPA